MMISKKSLFVFHLIFMFFLAHAQEKQKPNIVFFLIDDLGWSDLGCYGSDYYDTPHIDKLAKKGMKFTAAYMAPTCAPSRASLMTGEYPPGTGIYSVEAYAGTPLEMQKVKGIRSKESILPDDVTIAELLKEEGYTNGHFGKWHLGGNEETYPLAQGFDVNMGGCEAGSPKSFFSPFINIRNIEPQKEGAYLPDVLTNGACDFIEENKNRAFFLYFPFYQVHVPLHAKKEWVEKYEGKHPYGGQSVPAYGAMVSYMDDCVGRVLDKLDELGLTENTVIFFVSDNGGQIVATSNSPLRGQKGNLYEGGIRVPLIVKWPEMVTPGSVIDVPVSVVDFYPTLAEITGANIPEDKLIDGESMVPLLTDKGVLKREAIFWHLPSYNGNGLSNSSLWQTPGGAIRRGKWKLIEGFEDGSLQLFNLESDIGETMNLSSQYPGMANELLEELKAWQKSTNAPIPGEDNSQFEESSRDWISRANTRNLKETERLTVIR